MAATQFVIEGPIEIPCSQNGVCKHISRDNARDFLASSEFKRLASKQGVYVFALRVGRGHSPWYVGSATKTMAQECLTADKIVKFNEVIWDHKGRPVLFFAVLPGTKNKAPRKAILDMEKQLTQDALAKNPDIKNTQNTRNLPNWSVKGVVRSDRGKRSELESTFKKMMGL